MLKIAEQNIKFWQTSIAIWLSQGCTLEANQIWGSNGCGNGRVACLQSLQNLQPSGNRLPSQCSGVPPGHFLLLAMPTGDLNYGGYEN